MVLLALITTLNLPPHSAWKGFDQPRLLKCAEMPSALRDALMGRLSGMSADGQGVFNEDVSVLLAPYFPPGQTIEDARRAAQVQGLGDLQPFMGHTGPRDGTMFVSRFSLMSRQFSNVFVVVHFGFRRSRSSGLILDHVKAYLRADQM